jgi:uncharacterized protein YukE
MVAMSGPPYPSVNFDYGKAQAVVTNIDDVSKNLVQQRKDRMANGTALLTNNWTGNYADQFAGDLKTMGNDIDTLLNTLRALRNKVQGAIDAAHREQRRRDQANADYWKTHRPVGR